MIQNLPPKSVEGALNLQIIEGRIWLETEAQSLSMDGGDITFLQPGVGYGIHSEEESVVLRRGGGASASGAESHGYWERVKLVGTVLCGTVSVVAGDGHRRARPGRQKRKWHQCYE